MSKEITATQKEAARKQLTEAIWGETANNSNTEKETKTMTKTDKKQIMENMRAAAKRDGRKAHLGTVKSNTRDVVEQIFMFKMPKKEREEKMYSKEFLEKTEKISQEVVEKYGLDKNWYRARHFWSEVKYMIEAFLTREDAIELYENPEKLNELFDNAARIIDSISIID